MLGSLHLGQPATTEGTEKRKSPTPRLTHCEKKARTSLYCTEGSMLFTTSAWPPPSAIEPSRLPLSLLQRSAVVARPALLRLLGTCRQN